MVRLIEQDASCRAAGNHSSITAAAQPVDQDAPCRAAGSERPLKRNRFIPADTKHALWISAGGRCQTPGCEFRHNLQIDHIKPFSYGGSHELDNLQLLCPNCHRSKTLREFGYEWQRREVNQRIDACDWVVYAAGYCLPPRPGEDRLRSGYWDSSRI